MVLDSNATTEDVVPCLPALLESLPHPDVAAEDVVVLEVKVA